MAKVKPSQISAATVTAFKSKLTLTHDASYYGFLPTATGADNRAALQAAFDAGGHIYVSIPGIYQLDNTVYIGDNTTIEFCPGCTIKKVRTGTVEYFTNIIVNKAAQDLTLTTRNKNIKLIGNGLMVDINSIDRGSSQMATYILANFCFLNVDFLEVSGLSVDDPTDGDMGQYFLTLLYCNDFKIDDINIIRYQKDGIDIVGCKRGYIKNYKSNCGDDPIFVGSGWLPTDPSIGDTEDITIENWINNTHLLRTGAPCRIIAASWDDWSSRQYGGGVEDAAEFCSNNGNVYRKVTAGTHTSTVAPTHEIGDVAYADGITWRFIKSEARYTCNVTNIKFINCVNYDPKQIVWAYQEMTVVNNTHQSLIDNIELINCKWLPLSTDDISQIVYFSCTGGNLGTVKIKDVTISLNNTTATYNNPAYLFQIRTNANLNTSSIQKLIIDNCVVDASVNGVVVFIRSTSTAGELLIRNSKFLFPSTYPSITQFLRFENLNQFNKITLEKNTFSYLHSLFYYYTITFSETKYIVLIDNNFISPKYVVTTIGAAGSMVYVSGVGNRFTSVASNAFYAANTRTMAISLSGSQGILTVDGLAYGGARSNFIFNYFDLPIGKTTINDNQAIKEININTDITIGTANKDYYLPQGYVIEKIGYLLNGSGSSNVSCILDPTGVNMTLVTETIQASSIYFFEPQKQTFVLSYTGAARIIRVNATGIGSGNTLNVYIYIKKGELLTL